MRLVHLHGLENGKDHRSLVVLSSERMNRTLTLIRDVPVIIEVFSLEDFLSSLMVWNLYEKECL